MRRVSLRIGVLAALAFAVAVSARDWDEEFRTKVYPLVDRYCYDCHEPGLSKGDVPFLEAESVVGLRAMRGVWRNVGAQIHQLTMPPPDKKQMSEAERSFVSDWIEDYLQYSACSDGPYAGAVMTRRLNRLEYNNTIKDLLGVDLGFDLSLPLDSGAGEGFNNNGETLYLPPMLMERYLEAAQQIVDAAIVSPGYERTFDAADAYPKPKAGRQEGWRQVPRTDGLTVLVNAYIADEYAVSARVRHLAAGAFDLVVDGNRAKRVRLDAASEAKVREVTVPVSLTRGTHAVAVVPVREELPTLALGGIVVTRPTPTVAEDAAARHERLLGVKPLTTPTDPATEARERLAAFLRRAYRRPVAGSEVARFVKLYERGVARGDPYEEAMKLAIRGILVSPDFLFRIEGEPSGAAIEPINDHELAARLSYFLWSTMPDQELMGLADAGRLGDEEILRQQVRRLLASSRAVAFAREFMGQWLGTREVGGRVRPTVASTKEIYSPNLASDMREEPVQLFLHMLQENRNLMDLVDADYVVVNKRLAKHYRLAGDDDLNDDVFQRVALRNRQRGGILGLGAVQVMTASEKETSPVLRGAWVLDTVLGTPVPPPPADVPALKKGQLKNKSIKEILAQHRDHKSCLACHRIIDPIGFGMERYDQFGRWREKAHGRPVDAAGVMPTGEAFDGPGELKRVLLSRKDDLSRQLIKKLLGYALGRNLSDWDDCTIGDLQQVLVANDYRVVPLVEAVVLSTPFRNRQVTDK